MSASAEHTISVVIPVYQGELTLPAVVDELTEATESSTTTGGHRYRVAEILLVHDHGPDGSAETMRKLASHPAVRTIWLSRNFGQHAATLAGMASSGSDWIVTMDEDGQHDPTFIPAMLDVAMGQRAGLVYAAPTNSPPHGIWRNAASASAKTIVSAISGRRVGAYHSFRLVLGELGRSVAAYAGSGVYLDVAMEWVAGPAATCPVRLREEGERGSGYSARTLLSHFWRLMLTSGTRGLRLVSIMGVAFALLGFLLAAFLLIARLTGGVTTVGWTSVIVAVLVGTGAVLFALGVIAEYIGVSVNMAMGKPLYLIGTDREAGPLGRLPHASVE